MRFFIVCFFVMFSSCSSAKYQEKAFTERVYSFCKPHYTGGNFTVENYKTKVCRHYCVKWKFLSANTTENCKEWKLEELDFTNNHDRFSTARFIIMSLENLKN